ncbi:unnamed protein product, partial [Rotaria sp. Silwood2]
MFQAKTPKVLLSTAEQKLSIPPMPIPPPKEAANEAIPWSEFTDEPRVNIPNKRGPPKLNPDQIVSTAQTVDDAASRIPLPGALPSVVSKNRVVPANTEDSTRINSVTTKMPHTKVKCNKERPCNENPKISNAQLSKASSSQTDRSHNFAPAVIPRFAKLRSE